MAWAESKKEKPAQRAVTFTFDTGMLIALERRKQRPMQIFRHIVRRGFLPIVPAVVYLEWWRGKTDIREEILAAVIVEGMPPNLGRAAGEAIGRVRGSNLADAVVMASAALRGGGVVYTADLADLDRFSRHFPTVVIVDI
jgi:hypothetical protein